jgi:hypothetical protein
MHLSRDSGGLADADHEYLAFVATAHQPAEPTLQHVEFRPPASDDELRHGLDTMGVKRLTFEVLSAYATAYSP